MKTRLTGVSIKLMIISISFELYNFEHVSLSEMPLYSFIIVLVAGLAVFYIKGIWIKWLNLLIGIQFLYFPLSLQHIRFLYVQDIYTCLIEFLFIQLTQ